MTPDELKAKLRELGIDPENPVWTKSRTVDLASLPVIQKQREGLAKVADLLEMQVASDEAQIAALREQIARAKRGGGR